MSDGKQQYIKSTKLVITASALGTLFEWYDFFIYGSMAVILGELFFQDQSPAVQLLLALALFGAGFGVRPIGAILFGVLGDRIGRKYTFLMTITLMGLSTFAVGLLPTFATAGVLATAMLVALRLLQGLALGGEYGGAAIYVAEHAPPNKRGLYTSWIQVSVTSGALLALIVILICKLTFTEEEFLAWAWRIPFLLSFFLLLVSLFLRMKLGESPVYQAMRKERRTAKNPLHESFSTWKNVKRLLVALFGVANGLTVIFYTAQTSTLLFLQKFTKIGEIETYMLMAIAYGLASPFFVFFGWLSDHVGRKKLQVIGYTLFLIMLFPVFKHIGWASNQQLMQAMETVPVTVVGRDCSYNVFASKQESDCGQVLDILSNNNINYSKSEDAKLEVPVRVTIGDITYDNPGEAPLINALIEAGYPEKADPEKIDKAKIIFLIFALTLTSAMSYGAVGALLPELFPARFRYTSLSIPYHVGAGYFGGFLPFISQFMIVKFGNAFVGLWYSFIIVLIAFITAALFLPETRDYDINR